MPKAGELVRPVAIAKLEHIPRSAAFGTIIVERIFDVLSFMLSILLIPLMYTGPLTQTFPWLEEAGVWLTFVTFLFLGGFVYLTLNRDSAMKLINVITKRINPVKAAKIEKVTHSFLDGFLFLRDTRNYFMILFLSMVIWGFYVVMMYLPFYAFDMPAQYGVGWGAAWVVQAISSIGIIIPTPAATGSYHYFVIQTLTKLYGVNDDVARSYAAATHAVAVVGITLIGLYYFIKDKIHLPAGGGLEPSDVIEEDEAVQ